MNGRQKEEMITPGKIIEILASPAPPATPNTHFILRECGTNSRLVRWFSLEEFEVHPSSTPAPTTTTRFPINIIENRLRYYCWYAGGGGGVVSSKITPSAQIKRCLEWLSDSVTGKWLAEILNTSQI